MCHHQDGSSSFMFGLIGLCDGSVRFDEAEHSVIVFVLLAPWVAGRWPGIVYLWFCGDTYGVGVSEAGANAEPNETGYYAFS